MDIELKDCPFCGSEVKMKGGPWAQESFSIWCKGCMHHMDGGMDESKLAEKWNRRNVVGKADDSNSR
ncbi:MULTISPECIES: Lar family restriction alleviation protein [unclassified Endozoicomonas]|uniref:Lar family restriction alleviation protein n=1 Tax=unclassified Endozoicomonas TaxID=2644528 RepID=UPI003BB58A6B